MPTPEAWLNHASDTARERELFAGDYRAMDLEAPLGARERIWVGVDPGALSGDGTNYVVVVTIEELEDALVATGLVSQYEGCAECSHDLESGQHLIPPACRAVVCPDPSEHHAYAKPPRAGLEAAEAILKHLAGPKEVTTNGIPF